MSVVEQTLREDPGGVYAGMDFATRDRYRHVVENDRQAQPHCRRRRGAHGDRAGARGRGARAARDDRAAHVGYYLIDDGRAAARAGGRHARCPAATRLRRRAGGVPLLAVSSARSLLITLLLAPACWRWPRRRQRGGWLLGAARRARRCSCASQLAVALVNWLATLLVRAAACCRAWISPQGIPPESRTLVVVPTMLASAAERRGPARSARGPLPRQSRRATCTSPC